jgi:hypothetical protein
MDYSNVPAEALGSTAITRGRPPAPRVLDDTIRDTGNPQALGMGSSNQHFTISSYDLPDSESIYKPTPQEAAMAATATASGQWYPYSKLDELVSQVPSEMAAGVKRERTGLLSPQHSNNWPVGPRRGSSPTNEYEPSMPEMGTESPMMEAVEQQPFYVNAKQFHRILNRRVARQKLEETLRLTSRGRKPCLTESRHTHAMRRPRGPGGRFLTADEVASIEHGAETKSKSTSKYKKKFATCDSSSDVESSESRIEIRELQAQVKR